MIRKKQRLRTMKETGIHENNLSRVAKMYGLYGFFICTKNCTDFKDFFSSET